jgi:hypothetical protein
MSPLFLARALRISKMSSCLRMPVAPGTSSPFAIFVSAPTLMSFSVDSSSFSGGGAVAPPLALGAAAAGAGCAAGAASVVSGFSPDVLSRSISFHSSSSPSPVTAETGSTEVSNTDSNARRARLRSPRPNLSIFVATTAASPAASRIHCHAARSVSSPGCRASTSRSPAGCRANTARTIASNSFWLARRAASGLPALRDPFGARA